jgi:glycerol-3-phosphate acyltransferase PlsY
MISLLQGSAAVVAGYVLGSLPIGYVLVYLFKGVDLREHGSGRTGGTNAGRAGGFGVGLMTAVGDLAKGAGAVWIARALIPDQDLLPWVEALAAAAAVVGHNWSLFLGWKGGAGTGPNLGAAIALWPVFGLALIPVVPLAMLVSGYASVASMSIAVAIPVGLAVRAAVAGGSLVHPIYGVLTGTAVVIALLPNIRRLKAGTERMVGPRARAQRKLQRSKQSS